jgi:CBS domain-containing protein
MDMFAQDVMSSDVVTVGDSASVLDAVKLLINASVSGLPVVDAKGQFVGIVTEFDVIRHVLGGEVSVDLQTALDKGEALSELHSQVLAKPVRDLMTRPALVAAENTPLKEIAELVVRHQIKGVPVLRDGAVVGMVSRADLVKALLSGSKAAASTPPVDDDQIRRNVINALQRLGLPLGGGFDVVVRRGTVHLWGRAYDDESYLSYQATAAKVPGVTEVLSHMQVMPLRPGLARRR